MLFENLPSLHTLAVLAESEDSFAHYGMPRRSGRYPWGSGEDPYQHEDWYKGTRDFYGRVEELQKTGWKPTKDNIEKTFNMSPTEFNTELAIAKNVRRMDQLATVRRLREKEGLGWTEIGKRMGINESSVRSLYETDEKPTTIGFEVADFLKSQVDKKKMIDVGAGVNREMGITQNSMEKGIQILKDQGYHIYNNRLEEVTNPGKHITQRILTTPDKEYKDVYKTEEIHSLYEEDYTMDKNTGKIRKFQYPESMDSSRLFIRYGDAKDSGLDRDGLIEIRPGVKDLSLGEAHYAQVRILVDHDKYLKGMAVYSDNVPDGYDVVFNTNKKMEGGIEKALKSTEKHLAKDPTNPFGSLIMAEGQSTYFDDDGKEKLSLINKTREEGQWTEWKDTVPSQFLSKQSLAMAKQQLTIAKENSQAEFEEIKSLTNPVVKKYYLEKFADQCDSAAVDLKAASLPGQKYKVIIPVNTLKDNEVYAPAYENGTELALIRYPHQGTFEIPILKVNNNNKLAKSLIGNQSEDAVCINKANADRLSGADYDGDTVMCIPTNTARVQISSKPLLEGLIGFDPKEEYACRVVKDANGKEHLYNEKTGLEVKRLNATQKEMGVISNLITDMSLAGANPDELARATRHSMTIIDAEKHGLDYKKSERDNNIAELKRLYQIHVNEDGSIHYGGASTLISSSKADYSVNRRQGDYKINVKGTEWYDPSRPEGAKIWKELPDSEAVYPIRKGLSGNRVRLWTEDGKTITYSKDDKDAVEKYIPIKRTDPDTGEITYTNKAGDITYKTDRKTQPSTKMAETDDAMTLVSQYRYPMELVYAEYANSMKSMANQARLELYKTPSMQYSPEAKKQYAKEVADLTSRLNTALLNQPKERAAQRKASVQVQAIKDNSTEKLKKSDISKKSQVALSEARKELGSIKRRDRNIEISEQEWKAIQSGAVSGSVLRKILNNTDPDKLRALAMPKTTNQLSDATMRKIKQYAANNYSLSEIASKLGISTSTVYNYLNEKKE